MSNLIIASRDHVESGTMTTGSEVASLPASNLQTQSPGELWRTDSMLEADTWAAVDFGGRKYVSVVSLINHNLTQGVAQIRVRLADDAPVGEVGSTSVYDSGWFDPWPTVEPFGELNWGVMRWGGILTQEELAERNVSAHHVLATSKIAQHLRIDITDTANEAGYLQAGRLFAGVGWEAIVNMGRDWSVQVIDNSPKQRSAGNVVHSNPRPTYRRVDLRLQWMTESEAYNQAMELDQLIGHTGEVVVLPKPDDTNYIYRHGIHGVLEETSPIAHGPTGDYAKRYTIEELV